MFDFSLICHCRNLATYGPLSGHEKHMYRDLYFSFKPLSDEENLNPRSKSTHHSHRWNYGDLSTLPSPSSSVVDLDSNAGTVETDVLLSSYKAGVHPSGESSIWSMLLTVTVSYLL